MAIPSSRASESALVIQDLPTEMLSKIFVQCLPENPLVHRQPDVMIAPMVLCHVCAQWRAVALGVAELWTHLYHVMRVSLMLESQLTQEDLRIFSKDFEFLRWWRGNMRGSAPFLRLGTRSLERADKPHFEAKGQAEFVRKLLSSAYHLQMSESACLYLGGRPLDQPEVHTFILRNEIGHESSEDDAPPDLHILPFRPAHPIRRIYLEYLVITKQDVHKLAWSHLTHASLVNTFMTIPGWHALIRECVSLQFGKFDFEDSLYFSDFDADLPFAVMPQLRQLIVRWWYSTYADDIFRNLHLPALVSLSLETTIVPPQLQASLSSTPALKELVLSRNIPHNPATESRSVLNQIIEGLTAQTPLLERVVLELGDEELEDFEKLLGRLLRSEWLQLGRSNIKTIEFQLNGPRPQKKREILDILQKHSFEGVDLILSPCTLQEWNRRFDIPKGGLHEFFQDIMFIELL